MKNAAKIGFRTGVRTFAQTAAGTVAALPVASYLFEKTALLSTANSILTVFLVAALAGVAAGLQNFAENL